MKISIITPCFNSEKTIRDTIRSILGQTFKDIEYIIVDGKSTDNTLDVVGEYCDKINRIISEKDKGIYDAMNKGVKISTGDIVGILNSDDVYNNEEVLFEVHNTFINMNVDSVYGDLDFVDYENIEKIVRRWRCSDFTPGSFLKGWHPPHPTFFVKREVYEKFGYFDTDLNVSADFELMLRFLERNRISTHYIPKTLVKMRVGGESTSSIKKIVLGNCNCMIAFGKNGFRVPLHYPLLRLIPKLLQFWNT